MPEEKESLLKQAAAAFTEPKRQEPVSVWTVLAAEEKARAKKTAKLRELRLAKQKVESEELQKASPKKARKSKVK